MSDDKPAFTPGPWWTPHLSNDATTCNCAYVLNEGYCGAIATIHVDNGEGGNDSPPLEEAKANGRLIAAAPDLYAALVETLKIARRNEAGAFVTRAEAALAKASPPSAPEEPKLMSDEWNDDMEAAPKDGRALLFFDPSRRDDPFQCGFWLLNDEGEHNHDGGWWLADGREIPHPTHWRELPALPSPPSA